MDEDELTHRLMTHLSAAERLIGDSEKWGLGPDARTRAQQARAHAAIAMVYGALRGDAASRAHAEWQRELLSMEAPVASVADPITAEEREAILGMIDDESRA